MRDGARIDGDHLVHDDRAGTRVDDDLGRDLHRLDFQIFDAPHEGDTGVGVLGRDDAHHAPVDGFCRPLAHGLVDGFDDFLRGAEIGMDHLEMHVGPLAERSRHFAFDGGSTDDASGQQVIDLRLAAACRSACTADHQVALCLGVNLPVGPFERGHDQRPAAQTLGVTHGGYGHVNRLADAREGRQVGRHHHRSDVFQLQRLGGWQRRAELCQHVDDALRGEGRLCRLVTRAVQTDDNAVADQLVVAHPLYRG